MTAEVAVMNRMGIALAADSVVSIYANGVQPKTHDSVAKLFMLSEWYPVGIMVYNSASLLGVPWETIIKLFRKSLQDNCFERLECYGEELTNFLANSTSLFPREVQEKYFQEEFEGECRRIVREADGLYDLLPLSIRLGGAPTVKERALIVRDVIDDRLQKWKAQENAKHFTEQIASAFLASVSGEVNNTVLRVFSKWPVEAGEVNKLNEIAHYLVFKKNLEMGAHTGLVIGGYGESEHFPVVQHIVICGMYGGVLKREDPGVVRISEDKPSYVESFADTEAVNDFFYGASGRVLEEIGKAIAIIRSGPNEALQRVTGMRKTKKDELMKSIELQSEKQAKHVEEKVGLLIARRFWGILGVVQILPLKELARVAETLVSLSSFNKRLSLEAETVGEPIDVAVISKGDGFIWINRKHYFKRELNHRYFREALSPRIPREERDVQERRHEEDEGGAEGLGGDHR